MTLDQAQLALDRYEVADAVHRFTWGFDHNDPDMFRSAFVQDAVVDIRPAGRRLDLEFPLYEGRENATAAMMGLVGPLDTSHTASNVRITVDGDVAHMTCNVMAQHFRPGTGLDGDAANYLMMNLWSADLIRDGQSWLFRTLTVDCAWTQGDLNVIMPSASSP